MFSAQSHPSFKKQPEGEDVVWRYMDLARFISLLQNESLFFTRVDLMDDQWEGHLDDFSFQNVAGSSDQQGVQDRIYNFINCWNLSAVESVAMWQLYQKEGRGVAIKSAWSDLIGSITSPFEIHGAMIDYIDYDATRIPFQDNQYNRFMYKRLSFEHEHEVRLVHWAYSNAGVGWTPGEYGNVGKWTTPGAAPPGVNVSVDLRRLIKCVVLAPETPTWIIDVVTSEIAKYGFGFKIATSDLSRRPLG